ncbi:oligopeptidase A [Shewanella schlegeliana]|uniref:oligopeptidase A n=1 Tax=Shewanella schlegeliana TaxID=190308 RepID=A0ABS1T1S2_9GAMM|nr:oligopeptidase A [Shewanella schlegeliana]MBL4914745.1 oligopeptidase A [Shewanella schlegeliana]MCL1109923.1 oligopeptidase A [Shewanella schlegeliana]GIU25633.1 oligopeptidase A [Shewanella schlegeliana]
MSNPLLNSNKLPPFSSIQPEHIQPAVEQGIANCRQKIEEVLKHQGEFTWDNLVAPLEEMDDQLGKIWSPISHMNSVVSSEEWRKAHDACLPLLSEYGTFVGQHQGLYEAYKSLAESPEFAHYSQAQKKLIENSLRDFELSGIGLSDSDKLRYGELVKRMSELTSSFSNQLLDATQAWTKLITDEAELKGLPESAIAAAKAMAEAKELDGWLFTLDFPSYLPVMMYSENRQLREECYRAFVTRASDQGPNAGEFDNGPLMDEIIALRHEVANLLGFDSFAHKSLATKMAESPAQVLDFLTELAARSKSQGETELAELTEFAEKECGVTELEPWDLSFYAEKLKHHRYEISQELLRPYFPENKVLSGLFYTVSRLFGLKVEEQKEFDSYHKDVRFFHITDSNNEHRGSFYLDLYAREGKRGGAWMDDCRARRMTENGLQDPVAYLTCNFNAPVAGKPALFTHEEVTTLFHEFGHGIHHMLTKIDVGGVSGISGVPWDAVELPSQFMENWCYEEEALAEISGHYETGEPLPKAMLDKMLAAKNFQSGMMMLRQLEFSLFDFKLHLEFDPAKGAEIQQKLDEVREQVAVIKAAEFNRFQHSFAHIFAGGYAAGYYSYKWAEVLSADAFSLFEEQGIFNAETGQRFLENILEMGGSEEPMELFKRFRGREPQTDALLRHSGING